MSILAQQNITNAPAGSFAPANAPVPGDPNLKWQNNLGQQSRDRAEAEPYFKGYSYRPEGISVIPSSGRDAAATRPRRGHDVPATSPRHGREL
mgnify:CR=1 FL=1